MDEVNESWLDRHDSAIAWILFAAAFLIRATSVHWDPLWTDEAITVEFSRAGWDGLVLRLLYDASPPGSYLFFSLFEPFTISFYEVRYLSALAGSFTILAVYIFGKRLYGSTAGLFAAFLLTINPYHFFYSQEIRYPALLALFITLQMWAFVRLVDKKDWSSASLWIFLSAAASWIQYFTFFILFAQVAWLLLNYKRLQGLAFKILMGLVAWLFLILPMLPIFFRQLETGKPGRPFSTIFDVITLSAFFPVLGGSEFHLPGMNLWKRFTADDGSIYLVVGLLFVLPFLFFFIRGLFVDGKQRERAWLGVSLVLLPWFTLLFVSRFIPLFRPKYLVPLIPVALCIVAAGVLKGRGYLRIGGVLILPLIFLTGLVNQHTDPLCRRENWNKVASVIETYGMPGDVVLLPNRYHSLGFDFAYRGNLPVVSYVSDTPHELIASNDRLNLRFKRLEQKYHRFWIIDHKTEIFDPEHFANRFAEKNWKQLFIKIPKVPVNDVRVSLYARDEVALSKTMLSNLDFNGGIVFLFQLGEGFLEQTAEGYRWMGRKAEVTVAKAPGDNLVYGCFFVHLPFFKGREPVARLYVNEFPVAEKRIVKTDMVCLKGTVPEKFDDNDTLRVGIEFDKAFVPDDVLKDGDMRKKTALVEKIGITKASRWIEKP